MMSKRSVVHGEQNAGTPWSLRDHKHTNILLDSMCTKTIYTHAQQVCGGERPVSIFLAIFCMLTAFT